MQPHVTNYSSVNTSCRCGKETSFWYKRYIILNKNNKCTTSEHNSTCFMNLIVLVWALIKLCELKYRVWHIYFQLWKNLRTDFHSVICYGKHADPADQYSQSSVLRKKSKHQHSQLQSVKINRLFSQLMKLHYSWVGDISDWLPYRGKRGEYFCC